MDAGYGRAVAEVQELPAVDSRSCRSEFQLVAVRSTRPVAKVPFPLMLKRHVWPETLYANNWGFGKPKCMRIDIFDLRHDGSV